jgi:hypothetical protein
MTTKPRPSLADRFATKAPPAAPAAAPAAIDEAPADPKDKRVQVLVRMTPAERKALRRVALDQDTTVQALVEDAIRDLLRRHGG